MVSMNEAFPSKYLKAADLNGRTVRVKIDKVQIEEVGRDKERKHILYFIGKEKGLVLNKTNAMTLASAFGDESDDWHEAEIEVFAVMTEMNGKATEGLRVRIPPRAPQRPMVPADAPPGSNAPPPRRSGLDDDIPF